MKKIKIEWQLYLFIVFIVLPYLFKGCIQADAGQQVQTLLIENKNLKDNNDSLKTLLIIVNDKTKVLNDSVLELEQI